MMVSQTKYFTIEQSFVIKIFHGEKFKQYEIHGRISDEYREAYLLWEAYPSYHNGLFSPLLVLRDFAARGQINIGVGRATNTADQYRCYSNSTRLLTFSM